MDEEPAPAVGSVTDALLMLELMSCRTAAEVRDSIARWRPEDQPTEDEIDMILRSSEVLRQAWADFRPSEGL
jgi:hypothetical protein